MKASELVQALNALIEEHGDKVAYFIDADEMTYNIRDVDIDLDHNDIILKQLKN